MADLQLQIQNLIKLVDEANNQLANIETILLQNRETHKIQIGGDIYNISKELRNVIYRDMEQQAYNIQVLLAEKLIQYKEKGGEVVDQHIQTLQNIYQDEY